MKNKLKEHSHYPYSVETKEDKYIKNILSNSEESRSLISKLSDREIVNLMSFANRDIKDKLIKFIFDLKKENISDYLLIYFLENSFDIDEMSKYFSQFIPGQRISDLINKSRLKVSKIEENLRNNIRKILSEIYK